MTISTPAVDSVWRMETGGYVRIVAVTETHVYVRNANGSGHTMMVLPAWFTVSPNEGGMELIRP